MTIIAKNVYMQGYGLKNVSGFLELDPYTNLLVFIPDAEFHDALLKVDPDNEWEAGCIVGGRLVKCITTTPVRD